MYRCIRTPPVPRLDSTDVRVRVHYSVQSAMRNAVQKKIKDLEETQLQKLDSSRVKSSTVCMTLTQVPGPPLPSPSLRSRRHLNSRRTAAHSAARASRMKFSVETCTCTFPPNSAFAVSTLPKTKFRKFSTYVNLSCKIARTNSIC